MNNSISIIIPIYNQANKITRSISSLKRQSYGFKNMEIILVNDGSEDGSDEICKDLENHYDNVHYFCNAHKGVSAARNTGIKEANGKYIFFLDADDRLSRNTVKDCVRIFDSVYDRVDLLTYPIETYYKGRRLEPHFRYKYLTQNGVVDLWTEPYVGQTTMNIVVKNRFDYNVLFNEDMSFSEDQKYCCDVLHEKLKMGFCATAKYIYYRSEENTSGRLAGSCYIFESSMKMFEEIFSRYEIVPRAFQGLYVNDLYWKMLENILFPYHYEPEKYMKAISRIKAFLRRCDNDVILNHPTFDFFEKFYLLRLKGEDSIQTSKTPNAIELLSGQNLVLRQYDMEVVLTKLQIAGHQIRILGFLKSVFFEFYRSPVDFFAIENGSHYRQLELKPSAHNYYRSHEATQRFYAFTYECVQEKVQTLRFEMHIGETILPVRYYYMPLFPINEKEHEYTRGDVQIYLQNNTWFFSATKKENSIPIWLYYDCQGVEIDNGLRQYLHDVKIPDGVDRYYVVTDSRQLNYLSKGSQKIRFGSGAHKRLFLHADKIITAYIEEDNIIPFPQKQYRKYANQMHFDTIYLQHGVMHIDMPWKYSPEKILADRIVVSTDVDYRLFRKNGYRDSDLWKVGMPRFNFLNSGIAKEKKILFAPSWRRYLVTSNKGHGWKALEKKFYASRYYIGIKDFLESKDLHDLLEQQGYVLDIKLHPIFEQLELNIEIDNNLIRFVDAVDEDSYSLFITDFSSFLFDFLYRDIPFLSFVPDYDEFRCGMNGYRMVDFMEKMPNIICKDSISIVGAINDYMKTGRGADYTVKFYNKSNDAMDDIYMLMK